MRRREFLNVLGGAAVLPLAPRTAWTQQGERLRRIGVLLGSGVDSDDLDMQARMAAFRQGLQQLGWIEGRNVSIDTRFASGKVESLRKYAAEMSALAPDVILVGGAAPMPHLLQVTRTVPIVFTTITDPVGAGYVDSMARPGGNATGFVMLEYSLAGKWAELLKEIEPALTRAAVLRDPAVTGGTGQFGAIQSVASSLGLDISPVNLRTAGEIERAITAFARVPKGGLIVTASAMTIVHRDLIIRLAARYRLPAVYHRRLLAASGGLLSYGSDVVDQYRQAAGYVDRILKGEKPADLPVQAPTKYELVINLKTAKSLGLVIPPTLLARANEVIE